jgi:hypothetical protein
MANSDSVNRYLNVYIQSGDAQKTLDILLSKEKKLTEELARTTDPKKVKQLNTELSRLSEPIDRARKKLSGELSPSLKDVQALVNNLGNRLKKMSIQDADFSKVLNEYKEAKVLLGQVKSGVDQLGAAQKSLGKESFLGSFFGNLSANLVLKALDSVKSFFAGIGEEAFGAEDAISSLKNALENAGRVDLLPKLADQADEFAERFRRLDNDDITAVFTKLIDFGGLTEKQITELTEVIINYSAKQKVSLEEGAASIIKALSGNGKAIKSYGINIKDAGTLTERYGLIVGQLGPKLKGAELAAEETGRGISQSMGQRIKDVQERLGLWVLGLRNVEEQQIKNTIASKKEADQGTILVARYEELSRKANKTAAEKEELKSITTSLAATFGSSVVEINKETGALTLNVEATKSLIKQKLLLANSKAAELAAKLNAAQEKEIDLTKELGIQTEVLNQKQKEAGKTFEEVDQAVLGGNSSAARRVGENPALKELFNIGVNARNARNNLKFVREDIDFLTKSLEDLGFKKADVDKLFKPVDPGKPIGTNSVGEEGDDKKKQQQLDKLKALKDEAEKILREARISILSDLEKELGMLESKFLELGEKFKGHNDLLLKIEEAYQIEKLKIIDKFGQKEVDSIGKRMDVRFKTEDEKFKKNIEGLRKFTDLLSESVTGQNDEIKRNRLAQRELDVLKAHGKKKLNAELELLKEEEKNELANTELTEAEKEKIRESFRQERKRTELKYWTDLVDNIAQLGSQALDMLNVFDQTKANKENAELERDKKLNEKKKTNLERRLKAGTLTQLQYDRELQKLENDKEKREKIVRERQFRREQRTAVLQALINGAQGVTKAIATYPWPAVLIPIAFAVGTTAGQIASINSRKPAEFARGGRLGGQLHSEGGNPILDGHGRKIGEIEKDEGIINRHSMGDKKRYSVSGTPSQIASLINRIGGGIHWEPGATLTPSFMRSRPVGMNFPAIRRYYAAGGVFSSGSGNSIAQSDATLKELAAAVTELRIANQDMVMQSLSLEKTVQDLKANGIKAYTVLTDQEKQQKRLDAIRDDATLK